VRDHGAPTIALGHFVSSNRFGHRANLVDFKKEAVAGLAINGHSNALGVRYGQVITDDLQIIYFIRILFNNF